MKRLIIVLALALLCGGLRGWEEKDLETLLGHIADGMATGELVKTAEWRAIVSPDEEDMKRHGLTMAAGEAGPVENKFMKEHFKTIHKFISTRMQECEDAGDFDDAIQLSLGMLSFVKYHYPWMAATLQMAWMGGPIYRQFWNDGVTDVQRRRIIDGARERLVL